NPGGPSEEPPPAGESKTGRRIVLLLRDRGRGRLAQCRTAHAVWNVLVSRCPSQKKSGGDLFPAALAFRPEALLALRLAFLVGRRQCSRPDVDVALLRGRGVGNIGRRKSVR